MRFWLFIAAVALPGLVQAATFTSAPKVLMARQVVQLSGNSTLDVTLADPNNAGSVRQSTSTTTTVTGNAGITGLPIMSGSAYNSNKEAAEGLGYLLRSQIGTVEAQMLPALEVAGAASGFYEYVRAVEIADGSGGYEEAVLVGTFAIDTTGGTRFLGVRVNTEFQRMLYVVYYQEQVSEGLPGTYRGLRPDGSTTTENSWTLSNAGKAVWTMLSVDLSGSGTVATQQEIDGKLWHTIESGGRYDEPRVVTVDGTQYLENCRPGDDPINCDVAAPDHLTTIHHEGEPRAYNPDTGVNLLIEEHVMPLLDQHNASVALVDYNRMVQPVYREDPLDPSQVVADLAVQVDERIIKLGKRYFFISEGGNHTFRVDGQYGYLLNFQMDRYQVQQDGTTNRVASVHENGLSPTEVFDKQVTLDRTFDTTTLTNRIINPFPSGNQIYDWRNDTINGLPQDRYVYVAPLKQQ